MMSLLPISVFILFVINHAGCNQVNYHSPEASGDYPVDVWGEQLGCFDIKLALSSKSYVNSSMSYNWCWKLCQKQYANFAGLFNGNSCFCSNSDLKAVSVDAATKCNKNCAGNPLQKCGSEYGVTLFGLSVNPHRLREVIKNMEVKNIYVHRINDVEWVRYNQDAIDLRPMEITRNRNSVFGFLDSAAYVELTGSVDVIYGLSPAPSITQIHAIWDIVFAIDKNLLIDRSEVIYHRKTQCVWVEKINGEITDEFRFVRLQRARSNELSVVLRGVNSPIETVTLALSYLIRDNGIDKREVYKGKWFNLRADRYFEDYFTHDLFECKEPYSY